MCYFILPYATLNKSYLKNNVLKKYTINYQYKKNFLPDSNRKTKKLNNHPVHILPINPQQKDPPHH